MYVTQRFGMMGGAERHLQTLLNTFVEERPVDLVSVIGGVSTQQCPSVDQRIHWVRLNVRWGWLQKIIWTMRLLVQLPALMRQRAVAIVHTHSAYANVVGGLAAWIAGVRVRVASIHGQHAVVHAARSFNQPGSQLYALFFRWIDWLTGKIAHRIIVPSEATKRYLVDEVGVRPERVTVIYYGIRAPERVLTSSNARRLRRRDLGLDGSHTVVGMVAHLFPIKGHRYFIEAAQHLALHQPQVHYWIVGGVGNFPSDVLYALGASLVERGTLHFLGDRHDARDLLELMDVVVVPSLSEGFPYVVLEALGRARPVVASAVGGIPEIIQHGQTGLLVPPADSLALAGAIEELLLDPEKAEQLGREGRQVVLERFTEDRMMVLLRQLYEQLSQWQAHRVSGQ